ncbi:MAG: M1 family aminopeptidase [Thermomicrobiales bacterium]
MTSSRLTRRAFAGALSAIALRFPTTPRAAAQPTPVATPIAGPSPDAATAYTMDVTMHAESNSLAGTESIAWRNGTGHPQETLFLRLYPNAAYYTEAETVLSHVTVGGHPATAILHADDPTVASIALGRTVKPGEHVRLDLAFTTRVPLGSAGSFGIFGVDKDRGTWALADWYPVLAGWELDRDAWYLDAPTPFGDPTFPETAMYTLTLETPAGYALVGTGEVVADSPGQSGSSPTQTRRVETGPVREFAMALLPDTSDTDGELRRFPTAPADATPAASPSTGGNDPTVSLALYADEDIPGLADAIVDAATTALPQYQALLGALPLGHIEIASAHLAGANGVSWPGMIWLDLTTLVRDGALSEEERPGLRFTVTHEAGHQWIGGLLGLNSNDHGFMLEGLTNALAIGTIRDAYGADAAVEAMGRFVAGPYSGLVRDGRDAIADQPLTDDTNVVLRALAVYGKAGLGFEAIRQELGNDAWQAALAGFAQHFRFGIFTPDDLRTALMAAASSPDRVAALWTFWFEQAKTTLPDIDPIVQGAGT